MNYEFNPKFFEELSSATSASSYMALMYGERIYRHERGSLADSAGICPVKNIAEESRIIKRAEDWWLVFLPLAEKLLDSVAALVTVGMEVVNDDGQPDRHWVNFSKTKTDANEINSLLALVSQKNQPETLRHLQLMAEWHSRHRDSFVKKALWLELDPKNKRVLTSGKRDPLLYDEIEHSKRDNEKEEMKKKEGGDKKKEDNTDPRLISYVEESSFVLDQNKTRVDNYLNWVGEIFKALAPSEKDPRILYIPPMHFLEGFSNHRTACSLVYLKAPVPFNSLISSSFLCGSVLFQDNEEQPAEDVLMALLHRDWDWQTCCCRGDEERGPRHSFKEQEHDCDFGGCFNFYHLPWLNRLCGFTKNHQTLDMEASKKRVFHEALKDFQGKGNKKLPLVLLDIVLLAYQIRNTTDLSEKKRWFGSLSETIPANPQTLKDLSLTGASEKHLHSFCELFETILQDPKYPSTFLVDMDSTVRKDGRFIKGKDYSFTVDTKDADKARCLKKIIDNPYGDHEKRSSIRDACLSLFESFNTLDLEKKRVSISAEATESKVSIKFTFTGW